MICIFQDTHVWVYTINNDGSFNYVDVEGIQSKFTSLPDNSAIDAAMTGIFKKKESLFVITGWYFPSLYKTALVLFWLV